MLSEQFVYTFEWASWSGILAGLVTALAVFIVMAAIGAALGFRVFRPKSDEPLAGLGLTFSLWAAVSIVAGMGAGGFVAGLFAGQRGLEHGFLVWALACVLFSFCSGYALASAMRTAGNTALALGSSAAGVAGAVGSLAAELGVKLVNAIKEQWRRLDFEQLNEQMVHVLRDTDIDSLQPEQIKAELGEVKRDIKRMIHKIGLNPSEFEQIVFEFFSLQKARLDDMTRELDKEAAVAALARNRNIPLDEAEQLVNNALEAYYKLLYKARELINDAREQAEEARAFLKQVSDQAREKADQMRRAASGIAACAALALIIAAGIAACAGMFGSCYAADWQMIQSVYLLH